MPPGRRRRGPRSTLAARRRAARCARPAARPTSLTRASAHGEDRAHARAHRLRASGGRRSPGRARRTQAPNACAERSTVPTLPGSRDAVQVHAQRARGRAPSAARRRRSRACPSRASTRSRARARSTSWKPASPSPVPLEAVALERGAGRPAARRPRDPRPRRRRAPLRARSRLPCRRRSAFRRGFCAEAMCVICPARVRVWLSSAVWRCMVVTGRCGLLWWALAGTKKGAVPFRSDARRLSMSIAGAARRAGVRQPTPRGRRRQNVGRCRRRGRRCPRAPCGRARRRPARGRA